MGRMRVGAKGRPDNTTLVVITTLTKPAAEGTVLPGVEPDQQCVSLCEKICAGAPPPLLDWGSAQETRGCLMANADSFLEDALVAEAFRRVAATILTSDAVSDHAKELALETLRRVLATFGRSDFEPEAHRLDVDSTT
jgi:hypothetical protein